jgi:DNA repair protein RecO (recombination protein O)
MIQKTRGIVLRTVKYGETSVVVLIYTESFGIQSYLVNGVRTSKKSSAKANHFQPGSILELVVYHNDLKNLQRLREFKWHYLYRQTFFDVRKNAVMLFMVELLQKTIKQPESHPDLYNFIEDAFISLDAADDLVTANFPLFFALHLTAFFGFRINDEYSEKNNILDLREGNYVQAPPSHPYFLEGESARITSQLLKTMIPDELHQFSLNHVIRRQLLEAYMIFFALHIQDFGNMRTLPVLQEIIS